MATGASKKNFDFRMSKKVAELTQVVHMLFTRNHEKEVEMDALRASYEHEISLVLDDACARIQKLDGRIQELEEERHLQGERIEEACRQREAELLAKLSSLESQLGEERTESQNSRDLLIQAQRDLHNIRQVQVDDAARRGADMAERDKELSRCRTRISDLEKELREKASIFDSRADLLRTHEKLRRELDQMKMALQTTEKAKEEVSTRNHNLEADVKALRKELAKRIDTKQNTAKTPVPQANGFTAYGEEIERLKRELSRYRMELSNREMNFNRMFTDHQPVNVRGSAGGSGTRRPQVSQIGQGLGDGMGTNLRVARPNDNRRYTGDYNGYSGEYHGYTEEEITQLESPRNSQVGVSRTQSLRSSQALNSEHLPQLEKLHALARPRMPKELLTNKR